MKMYLAGSLFTTAERAFNRRLQEFLLLEGHECWLPQEKEPRVKTWRGIFDEDIRGLEWCDAVVACLDGADADSGTAWEMGYAYAKGKPVVGYRTDFRSAGDAQEFPCNLMLAGGCKRIVQISSLLTEEVCTLAKRITEAVEA